MKYVLCLLCILAMGCGKVEQVIATQPITAPTTLNHQAFTHVLQEFVDEDGMVNYKKLKENPQSLQNYLETLAATSPENMALDEQLALWINAYNAYTLKLIITNYPVKSILRITLLPLAGATSAWDLKSVTVGGKIYTLQQVEHGILRKMNVPEIHAALVCAAKSCPKLRREAYQGATLKTQLTDQMRSFLYDPNRNTFTENEVKISKIFSWFQEDFVATHGSLSQYLAQFATGELQAKLQKNIAPIHYKGYNWALNKQPKKPFLNKQKTS